MKRKTRCELAKPVGSRQKKIFSKKVSKNETHTFETELSRNPTQFGLFIMARIMLTYVCRLRKIIYATDAHKK
jgi:hypothetical protein